MSENKCEAIMDSFFALDKDEHLPFAVTLHLLTCKKCRTQIRLCTFAERVNAGFLMREANEEEIAALMKNLNAALPFKKELHYISLRRWITLGVVMIFAMLLFGFIIPADTEPSLHLKFYLVFAGAVAVYCAFFVASNIDFFVKKIETIAIR
jgi:hypothetical protein